MQSKRVAQSLDGPPIRNANRGDSRESIRVNRFAEKKKKTILITLERFARIASNLRFAVFHEGRSAINLSNLGKILPNLAPGHLFYVRPVGGPENYLC